MSPLATSVIVLALLVTGALSGVLLRAVLPPDHLSEQSKDTIRVAIGLVGTMVALILGLLVASAKSFFDTQSTELTQIAAQTVLLDRTLAYYGPATKRARELLCSTTELILEREWSQSPSNTSSMDPASIHAEALTKAILELSPQDDMQRSLRANAISTLHDLGQTRWLMYEQTVGELPRPFLIVMVVWLSLLFLSFGLFAPPNATALASLFLAAVSVSGAILMILEMYKPYQGLIRVSREPLRAALEHLGH